VGGSNRVGWGTRIGDKREKKGKGGLAMILSGGSGGWLRSTMWRARWGSCTVRVELE